MKILLKREHIVCGQSLFHAPSENEEVSNYELLKEISDERRMWKESGRFKRERERMSALDDLKGKGQECSGPTTITVSGSSKRDSTSRRMWLGQGRERHQSSRTQTQQRQKQWVFPRWLRFFLPLFLLIFPIPFIFFLEEMSFHLVSLSFSPESFI